jgi:hypothetical protein
MSNEVIRPEAPEKKIRTSNDFELCYLRHQYLRRVKYNPTENEMLPYMSIVERFTKNTFFTYFSLFKTVGMYQDDVLNIGRVHLVSFLGLYALENNRKKKRELIATYHVSGIEPQEADFDQKNMANFTCFFKQRMEDLVRVCRQKVRNIKGKASEEFFVVCGENKPPKYLAKLLKEYEELGYRKVDLSLFKKVRKKANVSSDATLFQFDNLWYVAIPVEQSGLDIEDLIGSEANPYQNDHTKSPDELFANCTIKSTWSATVDGFTVAKEERDSDHFSRIFNEKTSDRKKTTLRNFIANNRKKVEYREEVKAAKKMLRSLDGVTA